MCLIIHIPFETKAVKFTKAEVTNWYTRNKDGMGCMYAGKVFKQLGTAAKFCKFFYEHYAHARALKSDITFHTRMRTHGEINVANCHPYPVGQSGYLIHNGVLSSYGKHTEDKKHMSDTHWFIQEMFAPIAADGVHANRSVIKLLESHIGSSNKLVYMDANGIHHIYNFGSGVEWRGCWFSNTYAWELPDELRPKMPEYQWGNYSSGALPVYTGNRINKRGSNRKITKHNSAFNDNYLQFIDRGHGKLENLDDYLERKDKLKKAGSNVTGLSDSDLVDLLYMDYYDAVAMPLQLFNKADMWKAVRHPDSRAIVLKQLCTHLKFEDAENVLF